MPKNYLVEDIKPKSFGVFDAQSKNSLVLDTKPKMGIMDLESNQPVVIPVTIRTLYAGMSMGLLVSLTYPTDISIT